jgi:myo-inositol 2-dehydrogenase/D-chiro-inositol 1-dehydrogenase
LESSIVNRQSSIVNLGLVGVGRWGQQHVAAIQRAANAQLVALCANTAESAAKAEAAWNLPCDMDFARFLARPEVEAVVLSVPNALHYSMARQALAAGKHVLVEKPMSFTRQECDDLIAVAQAKNLVLFPGHEFRVFTIWERFKQLLDQGAIGQPRFGSAELRRYPYSSGSGGWRRDPSMVGDWLLEEPIHYFDLMTWYMGQKPVKLYATASASRPERAVWHENFSALLNFEDGSYVSLTRTVASFHFRLQIRFTGSDGTLEGSWSAATDRSPDPVARLTLFHFGDDAPQEIEVSQQTGHAHDLYREIEAFAAAIQGHPAILSGLDGRRAVYLCQAAATSLKNGLPVDLDDWK